MHKQASLRHAASLALASLLLLSIQSNSQDIQVNENCDPPIPNGNQSETSFAIAPGLMVAAWNDIVPSCPTCPLPSTIAGSIGWGISKDNGLTWFDRGLIDPRLNADPAVAVHLSADPRFYIAALTYEGVTKIEADTGILIYTSLASYLDFPECSPRRAYWFTPPALVLPPAGVPPSPAPNGGVDRPYIAVDNSPQSTNGDLWLCFVNNGPSIGPAATHVMRLRYAGSTWTQEYVDSVTDNNAKICRIAIDDRTGYAWVALEGAQAPGIDGILVRLYNNASPPLVVAETVLPYSGSAGFLGNTVFDEDFGLFHLIYADDGTSTGGDSQDVFHRMCRNVGSTLECCNGVNLSKGGNFKDTMPAMAEAPVSLSLAATWYSMSPTGNIGQVKARFGGFDFPTHRYCWSADRRLSDADFTAGCGTSGCIGNTSVGDYHWVAASSDAYSFLWGDTRNQVGPGRCWSCDKCSPPPQSLCLAGGVDLLQEADVFAERITGGACKPDAATCVAPVERSQCAAGWLGVGVTCPFPGSSVCEDVQVPACF